MTRTNRNKWPYLMSYRINLKRKDYLTWNPGRDRQEIIDGVRAVIAYKKSKYAVTRLKRLNDSNTGQ